MNSRVFALLAFGSLTVASLLASAQAPNSPQAAAKGADQQPLEQLEGDWAYLSHETKGGPSPSNPNKITIKNDQYAIWRPTGASPEPIVVAMLTLTIDPSQDPQTMDQATASGGMRLGIYKLEGDTLTTCFANPGDKVRPKEFNTTGAGVSLTVMKRMGPASSIPRDAATLVAQQTRNMPPDQKAYMDAMRLADPGKKIEALQKFLVDFPTGGGASSASRELLRTLIKTYPDQKEKLIAEVDELIAAAPESAKSYLCSASAYELNEAGVLLEKAEALASKSIALADEQKFIEVQKAAAESRKLSPPSDAELKKRFRASLAPPKSTLGRIYLKQGKTAEAEKLLKEVFEDVPGPLASAALAEIALQKGDDTAALDYLAASVLAVAGTPPGTQAKLEALYAKLHKNTKPGDLEGLLDDRYRKLFPTLPVARYQPTPERSDRVVLAEVFTGAACPPCVAADLAFDAMLERYSRKDLVVMMYHLHIPAPDPLTNPSSEARSKFYGVRGVPSYVLDGEMKSGGGTRDMAQGFYDNVNPSIEQRLEAAAEARLTLRASRTETTVNVNADVSQIKGDATELKLQVALVEEMLTYSGENGIRLHPVVVRSLAGADAGGFAVDRAKPAAVEHTFDIAKVGEELKAHLDAYESTAPGGRKFTQKKHAIDPNNLSVVAFVQDQRTKKILQAAYAKVEVR